MTLSKPSLAKGQKQTCATIFELSRFCSRNNYIVVGMASKMLKYFFRNYECTFIYTYADRRWSDGNLYKKIGFSAYGISEPNYWYFKNKKRIHRFALRKTAEEPKNITEWKLRQDQGWNRIWDCGNLKYIIRGTLDE